MKNRISHIISAQEVEEFNTASATCKRILLKALSKANLDELSSGQNMGTEGGWRYCKLGYSVAQKYPKLVDDEEMSIEEYGIDVDLARVLIQIMIDTETNNDWAHILFALVGKDLMESTNYVRQRADKKKSSNIEYVRPSDDLNEMYEKRAEKAEETKKVNDLIKSLKAQLPKENT